MALPFLLVVVAVPVLLLGLVAAVVVSLVRAPDADLAGTVAAARRHGTLSGVLAVVVGVAVLAALVAASLSGWRHGQLVAAAPLLAATVHAAVVGVGELTWPRPQGRVRTARLRQRDLREATPAWLRRLALTAGAALAVACVVAVALSAPDGRSISRSWTAGSSSASFPGTYFALPVLAGLLLAAAATAVVLRLVVARPAVVGADPGTDAVLRRASSHRVLRASTAAALATLGGLCVGGGLGAAHLRVTDDTGAVISGMTISPGWIVLAHVVAWAGAGLLLAGPAVLAVPARPLRAPAAGAPTVGVPAAS
jgi:hypothetical protein